MATLWTLFVLFMTLISICRGDEGSCFTGLTVWFEEYPMPDLPYNLTDLEPYIDGQTVDVHYNGHLGGYRNKMNALLPKLRADEPDSAFAKESILTIMMNLDKVPEEFREDMRFFGGGFINHVFYFGTQSPNDPEEGKKAEDVKPREPKGYLLEEIKQNFGGYEELKKEIATAMRGLRGSGYIWMVRVPGKKGEGALKIITTHNQDSPVSEGLLPLLCVDLWEHSYYLKHKYKKWDHLDDFWIILNWGYVEDLDTFWHTQEEEQKKADERIAAFVKGNEDREKRKKEREEKEKKEKKEKKAKKEL